MPTKHKISIPEPCNENWDKMTPAENGRFCLSCSKTVVDFTKMLPDEVQHFFMANQNKSVCGRFKNSQLENIIIQIPTEVLYKQTQYHKIFLLALFIAMGTTLFSCQDKNGDKQKIDKIEVIQTTTKQHPTIGKTISKKSTSNDTIPPPPLPPPYVDDIKTTGGTPLKRMIAGIVLVKPVLKSENILKPAIDSTLKPTSSVPAIDSTKTENKEN
ncbi:hypothetical protein OIU83_06370 [Flavobacterium sp. LS1R49]|uniref:Uncharacterized protein n=1 Tax=Flavobacterium shii TaxID=2987687 RepID=A0A9X3C6U7_9FLAO|nr:hypothetical protein [Flavobacterium shii]MCV9927268.1 hypothetical protein [Flavobacterium shii]